MVLNEGKRVREWVGLERPRKAGVTPSKVFLSREGGYGKAKYHPQEHLEPQILRTMRGDGPSRTRVRLGAPPTANRQPGT